MTLEPRVVSMNVGAIRQLEYHGRGVTTAIWKHPVSGRVLLRGVNFAGDDQADRTVHGGVDKAVYAYSEEDYEYWRTEAGIATEPGLFGENLTTVGIDLSAVIVGERWRVGSTVLEVAQPRLPCYKLGLRLNDPHFPKQFLSAVRMGAYLRVITEGDVGAGDVLTVGERPSHGVTLRDMVHALVNKQKAAALRAVQRLPEFWQQVADDA